MTSVQVVVYPFLGNLRQHTELHYVGWAELKTIWTWTDVISYPLITYVSLEYLPPSFSDLPTYLTLKYWFHQSPYTRKAISSETQIIILWSTNVIAEKQLDTKLFSQSRLPDKFSINDLQLAICMNIGLAFLFSVPI